MSAIQQVQRLGSHVIVRDPAVSVVIPCYRSSDSIAETLTSVFAQTFTDFEVIVVNDGSPDTPALEAALEPFLDKLVYIRRSNGGAGAARNSAINVARGEFLAFIDADDVWKPSYLSDQYALIREKQPDMAYCDAELFGDPSVEGSTFMQTAPSAGEVDVASLLDLRCNVITSGTVIRRSVLIQAGMFEDAHVLSEDFHLWVRVAASGARIAYQNVPLIRYRVSSAGLSGDEVNRVRRAIDVFQRLQNAELLDQHHHDIIRRRIAGFEADLAVAEGKAALVGGRYDESAVAFARARDLRPSAKISVVSLLSQVAPGILRQLYTLSTASPRLEKHSVSQL